MLGIRVGIVVAWDKPNRCLSREGCEHLFQRTRSLNVTQKNHGHGAIECHDLEDVIDTAMDIAAKKDTRRVHYDRPAQP